MIVALTVLGGLLLLVTVAAFVLTGRYYVASPVYGALGGLAGWPLAYFLTRSRDWGRLAALLLLLVCVVGGVAAIAAFPWLADLVEQRPFVGSFAGGFVSGVFGGAFLRLLGFSGSREEA